MAASSVWLLAASGAICGPPHSEHTIAYIVDQIESDAPGDEEVEDALPRRRISHWTRVAVTQTTVSYTHLTLPTIRLV